MAGKHNQVATLWKAGELDLDGIPSWSIPTVVNVRWEYNNKLIVDANGREIQGQGIVYFPDSDFNIGDFIYDGESVELTPSKGSYEIKNKRSISNLSGTEWEYRALV